ncbi:TPA: hypothetical protein ACFM5R_002205, partial [Neisseria meningitidis]
FSQRLISVLPDKCPQSQIPSFPKNKKNQKQKSRHSRAGGNPGLSVRKLIGKNGFFRFYVLDSHFRGNDGM